MFALIAGAVMLIATVVVAQQQMPHPPGPPNGQNVPNPPPPGHHDPLADVMFPAELIMHHAHQLNLNDEQKTFMRGEIQKTTTSFQDLQWKLQDQMEALHQVMKSTSVNEEQALAQLNKVLDIEREIKRLHVSLAVRLKNHLTPEQQEQLHKFRMGPHVRTAPAAPDAP
jgi:Spy/CpxP family protein refolding chaperone